MQEELKVSSCTAVDDLPPVKFQREFWYYFSAFLQYCPSVGGWRVVGGRGRLTTSYAYVFSVSDGPHISAVEPLDRFRETSEETPHITLSNILCKMQH